MKFKPGDDVLVYAHPGLHCPVPPGKGVIVTACTCGEEFLNRFFGAGLIYQVKMKDDTYCVPEYALDKIKGVGDLNEKRDWKDVPFWNPTKEKV